MCDPEKTKLVAVRYAKPNRLEGSPCASCASTSHRKSAFAIRRVCIAALSLVCAACISITLVALAFPYHSINLRFATGGGRGSGLGWETEETSYWKEELHFLFADGPYVGDPARLQLDLHRDKLSFLWVQPGGPDVRNSEGGLSFASMFCFWGQEPKFRYCGLVMGSRTPDSPPLPQHVPYYQVHGQVRAWALALATGAWPAIALILGPLRRRVRRRRGLCITCGYNLTGNVSGVCPECGAVR